MRNLQRNQTKLWYVSKNTPTDEIDGDGNYTGEKISTYSNPIAIKLGIYPSNSSVNEEIFGKDISFDMIGVSNNIFLNENDLLFLSLPSDNYDITYDYRVTKIAKSLNTYQYGLDKRT